MEENVRESDAGGGYACLALIAGLNGLPVDAGQLRHSEGTEGAASAADLVRAAQRLGFKSREVRADASTLDGRVLPAIGFDRRGGCFILAAIDDTHALVQNAGADAPRSISHDELAEAWDGRLVLLARRGGLAAGGACFGYGWFIPVILKYRPLLAEVLAASLVLQLLGLVTPLFFQVVIDKVLVHGGLSTLDVLATGLLLVCLFESLLALLRNYVFAHTTNRIDVALGAELFRHLLRLPLAYFESRRAGDSIARVRELEQIRSFITGSALTLTIDLLFTVVFFAAMYLFSPQLTCIVLATLPVYTVLALVAAPILRARLEEKFNRGAENQSFLVETLNGIGTLKSSAAEPQVRRRWEEQLAAYVSASFRATHTGNVISQAGAWLGKMTTVAILWAGARLVLSGELSVGQLVAFNMLAARVTAPVLRVLHLWQDFQQAGISMRRLGDIINAPGEHSPPMGLHLPRPRGHIRLERVTFRYQPGGREVLRDFSLQMMPGEVMGVVGCSGSGKSTLAKLLQRLHVPEKGRVLVDGMDLATLDAAWIRRHVAAVQQDGILFNLSVRDNVALAEPGASMARVIRACRLAGAHEFIIELPQGYGTILGERGSTLSGGQRQRIALARALLAEPRILILDEATSALDHESEALIHQNMRHICRDRSVVIIAHRLQALSMATRICVIEEGVVSENGSHEELLRRSGYYARLWHHQHLATARGNRTSLLAR